MTRIYRNLGHIMYWGFGGMFMIAMMHGRSSGLQLLLLGLMFLGVLVQIMVTLELILKRLERNAEERT